jgi:anti-sigma factor RsiW
MLTCYRTRRRLDAFVDGALPAEDAHRVATHVAACARCQAHVEGVSRLQAALRRAVTPGAPGDWTGFWPGVVRGIEAGRREPAAGGARRSWRPRLAVGFGGALAAGLLTVLTFWSPFLSPTQPEGAVVISAADTAHPRGTVMVYAPHEKDLAVVWVFGLDDTAD